MPTYNNRSLFSDYYLKERVYEDAHWRAHKNKAWELRQRIANIVEKALPGIDHDTPEAEVEHRFIRPILDVLGHVYFVQPSVPSPEGMRRPDYAFFPSPEARQDAEAHKGQLDFFMDALAVGDAKAWERSLDKRVKGPGDPFSNHNPSYQIDFYLRATDRKWGLLTNGRHWRLYQRDLSYRLDVYYEIDLLELLKLDENAFLYFVAFFHKTAFEPGVAGVCFLDRAYKESIEYATKVSEELKDNVYEALRLLAEGLLSFPGNNLQPQDLDLIRENAFIVIYRLLFILYAEAREFLPVSNPTYLDTYSLRSVAHEIITKEPFESKLSPGTTIYWSRLHELFRLINNGDDFLCIPPYNGRLFDDQKEHQSLSAWKIGDSYLAAAIDQLARATTAGRKGKGFVSYRDLSIRELGSIYEGLLEHRPRYATQDVAVIKDNKREKFVPLAELGNRKPLKTYAAGAVYLETDKGERKATGSYYTPDYIVKYIVNNTLGPLLEDARLSDGNLIDSILSVKVLDPAMGSGHFLVEVTDYLAWALVEALGGDPRELEEDEIRWARREVVERCIYGVDLNPLAVDLAKLSLWLSTVSLDKPPNFLDHHLRCGNSLISAQISELGALPGKALKMKGVGKKTLTVRPVTIWEGWFIQNVATAVDHYFRIAAISSDKLQDIREKEKYYAIAQDILRRYQQVAHIWTSTYFGNEVDPQDYENLLTNIRATEPAWAELEQESWFSMGVEIGKERCFFHWELEFPEVFFDRNGNLLSQAGFAAVVGNPPWGADFEPVEKSWLASTFSTGFAQPDSYRFFMEMVISCLRTGGFGSLIVPNSWLTIPAAEMLRCQILTQHNLNKVIVLKSGVFEANINCVLFVLQKGATGASSYVGIMSPSSPDDHLLSERFEKEYRTNQKIWAEAKYEINVYRTPQESQVIKKIELPSEPLTHAYSMTIGVQAYHNTLHTKKEIEDRIYHASQKLDDTYWPQIDGANIDRYQLELEPKEYISCGPWCYYCPDDVFFVKPRILLRRVTGGLQRRFVATFASEPFAAYKSVLIIIKRPGSAVALSYLLALLNSRLLAFAHRGSSVTATQEVFPQLSMTEINRLPIRGINFTTPKVERQRLVKEGKNLYQEFLQIEDWGKVLSFAGERLPQKPDGSPETEREQSDVVHDLLTFLAEEMIRLHKEKQAEIKGFLTWLESYLGVSVENLRNKTKIKEYWKVEGGWSSFLSTLEQNRRAIEPARGIDVTRREPQETIRAEFDTSVAKLGPLLEYIELTDKLIDQIIYRLYGLTDDEIAIVEANISS